MKITDLLAERKEKGKSDKIKRDTFIYLPPKEPEDKFAQCSTCKLFLPKQERCGIMGTSVHVPAEASCGLYIHGDPTDDQPCEPVVKPKEAGLVRRQVRCENCKWGGNSKCGLYVLLNKMHPHIFEIEEEIEPKACCNAFTGKD